MQNLLKQYLYTCRLCGARSYSLAEIPDAIHLGAPKDSHRPSGLTSFRIGECRRLMDHSTSDAAGSHRLDYNLILDPVGSLINANQGGWHSAKQKVCSVAIAAWELGLISF